MDAQYCTYQRSTAQPQRDIAQDPWRRCTQDGRNGHWQAQAFDGHGVPYYGATASGKAWGRAALSSPARRYPGAAAIPTGGMRMLRSHGRVVVVLVALAAVFASGVADAQWVMLARHVIGRVQTLSQTSRDGQTTFDTASVIIEVPADKVYATVLGSLDKAATTQGITINRKDAANRSVEIYRGDQTATLQVTEMGEKVSQLMVSSIRPVAGNAAGSEAPATPVIVERILAVCQQMNVHCTKPGSP
jgi:hypothetical protein